MMDSRETSLPLLENPAALRVGDLLVWGRMKLESLGETQAEFEAERLLEHLLNCSRSELYLRFNETLGSGKQILYCDWIDQRKSRMPLGYILGKAYFWDLELSVGPGCLVPRPETEMLVESVIRLSGLGKNQPFLFLDCGTGSGAISLALLRHFTNAEAVLLDASPEALAYAKENLKRYGLEHRAQVIEHDFRKSMDFLKDASQKLSLIVSNPPYLSDADMGQMEPELAYEPRQALWGGKDGLDEYRSLVRQAAECLKPGGCLAFEVGQGQSGAVSDLIREQSFFAEPEIILDYLGVERVVMTHREMRPVL